MLPRRAPALAPGRRPRGPVAAAILVALLAGSGCGRRAPRAVQVAAAASLRRALPEVIAAFAARPGGCAVRATYAGSGTLRRQVEAGAPIDAVLLASPVPVDRLIAEGLADAASRRVVATNRLVLIVPRGRPGIRFAALSTLPPSARLAVGDPATVPAGSYARAALRKLGTWDSLSGRLVFGGDVAAVLTYARRGEVDAAIVYATEVVGISDVEVSDEARAPWAPQPEVVAALLRDADPRAGAFLAFSVSPVARRILARWGFGPPASDARP